MAMIAALVERARDALSDPVSRALSAARWAVLLAAAAGVSAAAQGGDGPFSGFSHDSSQPVEVAADSLEVQNERNMAIFRGSVDVRQGDVRMTANELRVTYVGGGGAPAAGAGGGGVERIVAIGDVVITNGVEIAQADRADYEVSAGEIVLVGDVLLIQDGGAIRADTLTIDLASGQARMDGPSRVQLQLEPASQ